MQKVQVSVLDDSIKYNTAAKLMFKLVRSSVDEKFLLSFRFRKNSIICRITLTR